MRDGSDARGRRVALEERSIKYANLGDNGGRAEDKKDESTESD